MSATNFFLLPVSSAADLFLLPVASGALLPRARLRLLELRLDLALRLEQTWSPIGMNVCATKNLDLD